MLDDLKLSAVFQDGTEKEHNVGMLSSVFPQFKEFETNPELFAEVKVDAGGYGISWNNELDLSADEIWECGITVGKKEMGLSNPSILTLQRLADGMDMEIRIEFVPKRR